MKKVLVMVLSANVQDFGFHVQSIRDTWGTQTSDDFSVLYYYGKRRWRPRPPRGGVRQIGDTLICDAKEVYETISLRTMMAFRYVHHQRVEGTLDFDYIFRCCCVSYVVPDELLRFVQDKPSERFYCGIQGQSQETPFASGSGYFLSRDLLKEVVENRQAILDLPMADDVALGHFMNSIGVQIDSRARRVDFSCTPVQGEYHYHLSHDMPMMHELHDALNSALAADSKS